jgi:NAD+ kinase
MIHHDPRNPKSEAWRDELLQRWPNLEAELPIDLVIGGDGHMLHTVDKQGFGRTYLGLNAGHIGFLLNDVTDWDQVVRQLRTGAWTTWDFPVLKAEATFGDGTTDTALAVNDFAVERSTGQTAHLRVHIDGHLVVDRLVADGLVFATSLGSTAYAFSAGGPACHPTLPTLIMTAICPHHPRLAPLVLPDHMVATVEVLDAHKRPVRAVADGRTRDDLISLRVGMSDQRVRLAWLEGHDFTTRMVRKILHP